MGLWLSYPFAPSRPRLCAVSELGRWRSAFVALGSVGYQGAVIYWIYLAAGGERQQMAKAHPISQARRCKLSSVLLLIAAMTVRERFVTKRANLRTSTSARLRSDSVYASTHLRTCVEFQAMGWIRLLAALASDRKSHACKNMALQTKGRQGILDPPPQ
jgi:hypothetical protein